MTLLISILYNLDNLLINECLAVDRLRMKLNMFGYMLVELLLLLEISRRTQKYIRNFNKSYVWTQAHS
jgi:hypothetical protein